MANTFVINETANVLVNAGLNSLAKSLQANIRVLDKNSTEKTIVGITDTVHSFSEIIMPHVTDYSPAVTVSNDVDVLNSSVALYNVTVSDGTNISVTDKVKIGPISSTVIDPDGTRTDLVSDLQARITAASGTLTIDTTTTWGAVEAIVPGIMEEYSQYLKVSEINGTTITFKYPLKKDIYGGFSFVKVGNTGVYQLKLSISSTNFAEGDKVILDIKATDGSIVREGIIADVRTEANVLYVTMNNELEAVESKINELFDVSSDSKLLI